MTFAAGARADIHPMTGREKLPSPYLPEGLRKLEELVRTWGYEPELQGDFERNALVVHSGRDFCGRVTIRPRPNNPAWQVEAIHRSWAVCFQCEVTRYRELRSVLELALRVDLGGEAP